MDDAVKLTGLCNSKVRLIAKELNIKTRKVPKSTKLLYLKKDLENYKKDLDDFWDKHVVYANALKMFGKKVTNLAKVEIPTIYRLSSAAYVVSLDKVKEIQNDFEENYISYPDAMELLDLTITNFKKTINEFNLTTERVSRDNTDSFKKEDIYKIKEKQEVFLKNALSYEYVYTKYGPSFTSNLKSYPLPNYARCNKVFFNRFLYYKKDEVDSYIQRKTQKEQSITIQEDTLFNTYQSRFKVLNLDGLEDRPYTSSKWNNFVAKKLKSDIGSDETKHRKVNYYVKSGAMLFNFLNENKKKEAYSLSTNQINLLLNTATASSSVYRQILYRFFKEIAHDIFYAKTPSNSRGFDFSRVKKHPDKPDKVKRDAVEDSTDEELYTFLEYVEIFSFLTDIDFHLSRFAKIENEFDKTRYLSIWLYLSIQLTNTWRKGDVSDFPKFNWDYILSKENINDIDWFFNNKISKEVGRLVVTTLKQHTFFVSKTGRNRNFRASDEVCQVLATILFLLDLNYKNQSVLENFADDKIMYFGTTLNRPYQGTIDSFFKGINLPKFKFKNKKMTKSILSFSKVITPAEYGILVPKNQREHKEIGSTMHYVRIPKEHMDLLSKQLFERGEFGYLYDALLDMVVGNKSRDQFLEERTEIIRSMQNTFGDINKIESVLKLSNFNTQTEVIDMLYSLGLDKCNEILNNIYFNNLPSKEDHIQCLYSFSGCKHPERRSYPKGEGCITCEYSIPNIYAITVLSNKLKEDLKTYSSTSDKIIKRKLSMRIFKYKEILKEAIKKYGKDYIYSCIGLDMTRDEFMSSVRKIEKPSEVIKSDIDKLIGG